jgi:hypothetical protein
LRLEAVFERPARIGRRSTVAGSDGRMYTLNRIVPWGRCLEEYRRMFLLDDRDLDVPILGCADGPASFNAELTRRGGRVVSCDPLYQYSAAQIRQRIDETFVKVIEQTRENQDQYIWHGHIASIEELGRIRMEAMQRFLEDFEAGRAAGRYVGAELPCLPFDDGAFELALCGHFLFLYSQPLSEDFHVASILELCRVARECRLFPLVETGSKPSRHREPVLARLRAAGLRVSVEPSRYEFQKGGHEMLRVFG